MGRAFQGEKHGQLRFGIGHGAASGSHGGTQPFAVIALQPIITRATPAAPPQAYPRPFAPAPLGSRMPYRPSSARLSLVSGVPSSWLAQLHMPSVPLRLDYALLRLPAQCLVERHKFRSAQPSQIDPTVWATHLRSCSLEPSGSSMRRRLSYGGDRPIADESKSFRHPRAIPGWRRIWRAALAGCQSLRGRVGAIDQHQSVQWKGNAMWGRHTRETNPCG